MVRVLAVAAMIGVAGAIATRGEFHSTVASIWIGLTAAFVLLVVGSIFRMIRRTQRFGAVVLLLGAATLLAIPICFFAARGVVEVETWRAKRYVRNQLEPRLEAIRASTGQYPREFDFWERPPKGAPRLRRFNYSSDGNTYALWVVSGCMRPHHLVPVIHPNVERKLRSVLVLT